MVFCVISSYVLFQTRNKSNHKQNANHTVLEEDNPSHQCHLPQGPPTPKLKASSQCAVTASLNCKAKGLYSIS